MTDRDYISCVSFVWMRHKQVWRSSHCSGPISAPAECKPQAAPLPLTEDQRCGSMAHLPGAPLRTHITDAGDFIVYAKKRCCAVYICLLTFTVVHLNTAELRGRLTCTKCIPLLYKSFIRLWTFHKSSTLYLHQPEAGTF